MAIRTSDSTPNILYISRSRTDEPFANHASLLVFVFAGAIYIEMCDSAAFEGKFMAMNNSATDSKYMVSHAGCCALIIDMSSG